MGSLIIAFIGCMGPVIAPDEGTTPDPSVKTGDMPAQTDQGSGGRAQQHPPKITRTRPKPTPGPNPRAVAALSLIEQGRALIKAGKPDDAIRVLERALNLHAQNGEVYYRLAEAWLAKGNIRQAGEYNRLAWRHLKNKPAWSNRLQRQKKEIDSR